MRKSDLPVLHCLPPIGYASPLLLPQHHLQNRPLLSLPRFHSPLSLALQDDTRLLLPLFRRDL